VVKNTVREREMPSRGVEDHRMKRERLRMASWKPPAGASRDEGEVTSTGVGPTPNHAFPIVGIGASAGGLEAFTQLLKMVPSDVRLAFVLIQHLDPTHTSFLCEALAKATPMPVSEAVDGELVEPNHVYVITPSADIAIVKGRLSLESRENDRRKPHLPIDYFLCSLAKDRGCHAFGVVLSGNASDGTEGLRAIKAEDGITFAQDPKSAKFGSMPRNAVKAGVVDYCLAIPELASELVRLSRHSYLAARQGDPPTVDDEILKEICVIVRNAVGVNFSEYKAGTFERRMARRMAMRRTDSPASYLAVLKRDPDEIRTLYDDLLIHVTSFFRDPEVFDALKTDVLPDILKDKPEGAPFRLWVAGCSSGEEVYSLAMVLLEFMDKSSSRPIQIFGSDISERIIETARAGIYPDTAVSELSDERRRRFFTKVDQGYRVVKAVRDLCIFVQHDLARDPPFSRLDLVTCRNVLIYFDAPLQKRVLSTLHYALSQPGFLVLGRTENIIGFDRLFVPADKSVRIFSRTTQPSALRFAPRSEVAPRGVASSDRGAADYSRRGVDVSKHLDRLLLARYAPPGVLINERLEIIHFCGQTGAYLQAAPGEPQNNIVKMARGGLLGALRATIARAKKHMAPTREDGVEVDAGAICNIVVIPFTGLPDMKEQLYVVLFEQASSPLAEAGKVGKRPKGSKGGTRSSPSADDRVSKLEHELLATKEYLQSLIEDHVRTADELGSANEELVSGNEELQSMNEELETAKEELQSTNEELTTVNDELQSRNHEATQVNGDLVNLLATVDFPLLILDTDRKIRRFTPSARSIMNVLSTDVGRPFDDIKTNIEVSDLDRQIAEVVETLVMKESEVQDREGHWYRMQIRPYKTTDNRIDGAILSLVDIHALRQSVADAERARKDAEQANGAKDQFLAILSHELRTPLTSVSLHAELLCGGMELEPGRAKRAGEAIQRATIMQGQLIDDLLDVSRIISGKFQLETKPFDLRTAVAAAIEDVNGLAARKSIELKVDLDTVPAIVSGDSVRLQQVASNLLTNAIKFTPQKGQVEVVLDVADGCAKLVVSDTGIGIEPGFLPFVFNRFAQEDTSRTRAQGGLGLGLAIVRHVLELHGGTVSAESPGMGKGSTFSVTLPLTTLVSTTAPPTSLSEISGMRLADEGPSAVEHTELHDVPILVVDDDAGVREGVAEILNRMGARVRVAQSAADAMMAIDELHPAVILCDIAMPGEDGYSFLRRLRGRGPAQGGSIPALALTALAGESDRHSAAAAGFQMYLAKPIDINRLKRAVVDLVTGRSVSDPSPFSASMTAN
jgi:two-component system CheB/CheR fusion protein